jgi:hypothetical protein
VAIADRGFFGRQERDTAGKKCGKNGVQRQAKSIVFNEVSHNALTRKLYFPLIATIVGLHAPGIDTIRED